MKEIIGLFTNTPVPTILIISGLVFMGLSFVKKVDKYIITPKRQKAATVTGAGLLILGIALYMIPLLSKSGGNPPPPPPPPPGKCIQSQISEPRGTPYRAQAINFIVPHNFRISWNPSDCPMIIQYYQDNRVVQEFRPSRNSGTEIFIPDTGETEIKIWYESNGSGTLCDNKWIWIR